MLRLDEMTSDIRGIYERYLRKDRGAEYAIARLWEDFHDENPDEEMTVYNLIIAQINLEQLIITDNNRKCVDRAVKNYESAKESVCALFTEQDRAALAQMCNEVKERESLWTKTR